jgi:hypothetical protein
MSEIPLTQGKVAIVSDEDYERIASHKWCAEWSEDTRKYYAARKVRLGRKQYLIRMHREVLGLAKGDKASVDHINGDGLDNRKLNLRLATCSENMRNRGKQANNKSGYKGVCWNAWRGKWMASIRHLRRSYYLGLFDDPSDAHAAYCRKSIELHGEFARVA